MTINELNRNLDKIISCYEQEAGEAIQYCYDDGTGEALAASYQATAKALASFKAEILAYLSQS